MHAPNKYMQVFASLLCRGKKQIKRTSAVKMEQHSASALGFVIQLKMVQRKTGLLFFTSEVCSHHVSLILQMQTTEACPFLPSPYTHHPMKAGATALQNYIATLDYLFISYSSLHCINFLLTNQALLLEKTDYFFQINVFIATQIHTGKSCAMSWREKGNYLLLLGDFQLMLLFGYIIGKSSNCVQILIIHLGTRLQV